jgi:RsiW-degrading membrane proteinase PrsW (M82 family)
MIDSDVFFFAVLGGLLPALVWLWFWLREDRLSPEPRSLIIATFCAGMIATLVALVIENATHYFFKIEINPEALSHSFLPVLLWGFIEEVSKFSAAYVVALRRRDNDEPIDNMIYLITAAVGFAALETALFLIEPLSKNEFFHTIITGNLRFVGTAPLHIISSAVIGISLAYAFCKLPSVKFYYATFGVLLASLLHGLFNFFIMKGGNSFFTAFALVWLGVVVLLLFFEQVKKINKSCVYD